MLRTALVIAVPLTALIALTPAEASSQAYPQAGPSSHSAGSSSGISLSPFTRYFHSNWHQQHNHSGPHHQARPVPTSTATSVPTSTATPIATATPSPTATPAPTETPAPTPPPVSTATPVPQSPQGTGGDARAAISAASARWHVSYGWLLRVASCESGLNPYAQNPSGASGLFQFMPSTYYAYAARIGETGSIWNAYSNANVAGYMFSIGQSYQWTCR